MAKAIRRSKAAIRTTMPLGKENFLIIGVGIIVIIVGYIALAEGSVEGFLPLVVAPVLLVLGYCVIIPFGILYKKSFFSKEEPSGEGTGDQF